ncbi:MAG: GTPase HflX, partial [Dokdonella sp.]
MFERSKKGERALLLQPQLAGRSDPQALEEFAELARSAGATVAGHLLARVERANPRYFVGSGKAEELRERRHALDADLILVNHALSPVQERNLEALTQCRVVDRTGLILDIFAQRARSHEGKLQVELAQLRHMATRLVRGWTHLERQRGGSIGLRGPGETQLELDRRLLGERVKQLQKRL